MDPGYFDTERKQNPREKANIISKFCFWYTHEIFAKGRKRQITISDIYKCSPNHRSSPRGDILSVAWKKELKRDKPSLFHAIWKVYGMKFLIFNIIYAVLITSIRLSTPWCLKGLINYFSPSHGGISTTHAYLYALGVVGLMTFSASLNHPNRLWLFTMAMKMRVSCGSLIYRKLLQLDLTVGGKATEGLAGHVINLLTTDAQRFDMACLYIIDVVRLPVEGVLIIYLMYRQIGVATFAGVAFLVAFIPLQGCLGKISGTLRRETALRTDRRIRLMHEVIQSIESIKMYVWEEAFAKIIGNARRKEMNIIKKSSWVKAVMLSCIKLNTKVAILLSIISYISAGNELTAAKVFVIFAYYDFLKTSLVDFLPLAISATIEMFVSVRRMQDFLLLPEVESQGIDLDLINDDKLGVKSNGVFEKIGNGQQVYVQSENNLETLKPKKLVNLKDYTVYWRNADDKSQDGKVAALANINLTIKPNTLTTVSGSVGSGKSTLLQAMMRELTPSHGHLQINGVIAYAAQDPWLFEASVRQNILFGQDLDLRRYKQVIKCCQLMSDLDILPHGDKTTVGERGASLSGGQRARISLARCVYQHADVYLLDDPLAAVDSKVAQALYEECIRGFLRDSATVLVTHRVQYAKTADNVCVMRDGKIIAQGTYEDLKNHVTEFEKLVESDENAAIEKLKYENSELKQRFRSQRSMSVESQLSLNVDLDNNYDPVYEGETQRKGSINKSIYFEYIRSGGSILSMTLLFGLFILAQIFHSSTDLWLKDWVTIEEAVSVLQKSNTTESVSYEDIPSNRFHLTREQCLYVYGSLIAMCIFCTWNQLVVFYNTCIKASIKLHDTMFRGVTSAPMWFFHHNPSGTILNRFSRDMGQIDTRLPVVLVDSLRFFLEVLAILVVVCIVNWWLLLPTAGVCMLLHLVRNLFLATSRELRRIEPIAQSQSLNHVSSTVSGLTTIRSTRHQRLLAREFDKLQDLHSSSWVLILNTNRAFGYWMDMICCLYLAFVTFSFFLFADYDNVGGSVGLAITQVIGLVGMCQFGIRQTAEVENQMTSVERILEYTNLPPEHPLEPNEKLLKTNHPDFDMEKWPAKGEIEFKNVSLAYEKPPKDGDVKSDVTSDYAIRDVSFTVQPSEKVAVVGRTGAGKSSLVNALFRLNKISGNVCVDGISVEEIGLRVWRSRLCALPQRPALFAATLRDNLDPCGSNTDAEIYTALEQVSLRDMVSKLAGGLATRVGDGGGNLSTGQRQLLCLARAALAGSSVLLLDEATANVDTSTDERIQHAIRTQFAHATVLTIAHRLDTVVDYDKVIVMDKGRIVEQGNPYELLTKKKNGYFNKLVEQTGQDTANMLFNVAKESYKKMEKKKES